MPGRETAAVESEPGVRGGDFLLAIVILDIRYLIVRLFYQAGQIHAFSRSRSFIANDSHSPPPNWPCFRPAPAFSHHRRGALRSHAAQRHLRPDPRDHDLGMRSLADP